MGKAPVKKNLRKPEKTTRRGELGGGVRFVASEVAYRLQISEQQNSRLASKTKRHLGSEGTGSFKGKV